MWRKKSLVVFCRLSNCVPFLNKYSAKGVACRFLSSDEKNRKIEETRFYDAIIVGGGMVGGALACSLGQSPMFSNKEILVLEGGSKREYKLKELYSNRVSALNKGTRDLFETMGVWQHVEAERYKAVKQMQVWEACSDAVITFNKDNLEDDIAYIVENDLILLALEKQLSTFSNVNIAYNSKVENIRLPKFLPSAATLLDLAQVELKDGTTFATKLLVGADGAKSQVREAMGVETLAWDYNEMGIVSTLRLSEPTSNNVAWQRFLPTGPIALLPLTDERSSLVWSICKEEAQEILSLPTESFVDRINQAFWQASDRSPVVENATKFLGNILGSFGITGAQGPRQLPPGVADEDEGTRAGFPLGFGHALNYAAKRAVLIGDAAHRIHPLAGQGVNLGFGDVKCLTAILEEAINIGGDIGNVNHLLKYQSERQKYNFPTMMAIDGLQRLYGTNFTPIVLARSLGLQLTNSLSPVKNLIMNHAAG